MLGLHKQYKTDEKEVFPSVFQIYVCMYVCLYLCMQIYVGTVCLFVCICLNLCMHGNILFYFIKRYTYLNCLVCWLVIYQKLI